MTLTFKKRLSLYSELSIQWILLLKPLVDMFYSLVVLDYISLLYVCLLFLYYILNNKMKLYKIDFFIVVYLLLITIGLLRDFSGSSLTIYIKIISPYILFYIGRMCRYDERKYFSTMYIGFTIAFIIDLILFLSNQGRIAWGGANTFKGFYFFKTDLAVALINYFFLLIVMNIEHLKKAKIIVPALLTIVLLFYSNSRIALLALLIEIFLLMLFVYENKHGRKFKINFKIVSTIVLSIIVGIVILKLIGSSNFFAKNGFISFKFNSINDLFSSYNTQGRSRVWTQVIENFKNANIIQKLIGVKFNTTTFNLTSTSIINTHSSYFGYLYSIGFVGCFAVFAIHFLLIKKANSLNNRLHFYVLLMYMSVFLFFGLSNNTYEFTNLTWNYFFTAGLLYNSGSKTNIKNKQI